MTCRPAPIAKSVSVAVGDSATIRAGRSAIVTRPLAALTETGKPPRLATAALGMPTATAAAASSAPAKVLLDIKNLRLSGGRWLGGCAARTPLPPRVLFVRCGAGDLARPLDGGITVAGQLRNRTGFAAATPAGEYVPSAASLPHDAAKVTDPSRSSIGAAVVGRYCGDGKIDSVRPARSSSSRS